MPVFLLYPIRQSFMWGAISSSTPPTKCRLPVTRTWTWWWSSPASSFLMLQSAADPGMEGAAEFKPILWVPHFRADAMQGKLADTHFCGMDSLPQLTALYPLRVICLWQSLSEIHSADCKCALTEFMLTDEVFNLEVRAVLAAWFVNNLSQAWRLQWLLFSTVSWFTVWLIWSETNRKSKCFPNFCSKWAIAVSARPVYYIKLLWNDHLKYNSHINRIHFLKAPCVTSAH